MGTVYTAMDTKLQREVALKMMKREMAADPEIMQAFYREARAGASLNHTNIIHIYSFDEFEGQPYLVMELANNGCLDGWIEREGKVPELHVLDAGIKIASRPWRPPSSTIFSTAISNPETFLQRRWRTQVNRFRSRPCRRSGQRLGRARLGNRLLCRAGKN